jgi:15-cis-phytoene desaturase
MQSSTNPKVIVLGGGVAGMSAAQELAERGFEVRVCEHKPVPGGKARSIPVPGSGTAGRADLPGEHGFRFFPGFYRHVIDTMQRIPYRGGKVVADNLIEVPQIEFARYGYPPLVMISHFPRSLSDMEMVLHDMFHSDIEIPRAEWEFYAARIRQILTSCMERRIAEYEKVSWWSYMGADSRSEEYRRYLVQGFSRTLVAARAESASARTIGDIYVQMLLHIALPGTGADRLLNGPTSDVWIAPWLAYLQSLGVDYRFEEEVLAINCAGKKIESVTIRDRQTGREETLAADYYLAAVPVEKMARLVTPELTDIDRGLASIRPLALNVQWMNGAQFYLRKDVPLVKGHTIFADSQWALTSVSQEQFWDLDLSRYGNGEVRGILSVDISDWNAPGLNGKLARDCTREEIRAEVWEQLKRSVNFGQPVLRDDDLVEWFLDPDIVFFDRPDGVPEDNREPLLVNLVDTWQLRPQATTAIPNLFLASDYVQTYTDLAKMEGANEAARRAVNGILNAAGSNAPRCQIWNLHEPDLLAPWRNHDLRRFQQGLPWDGHAFDL